MKKILLASIVAFAGLALATPTVYAQSKGKAKIGKNQKVKEYDFSGDDIDGELIRPEGLTINTRQIASQSSLIRIRLDFIKEILKSAEDL
jgi:hypothetical protein